MNNRLKNNLDILLTLRDLAYKYPHERFHQLLQTSGINVVVPLTNSEGQNELVIRDDFYVESFDTYERMKKE